MVHRVNLKDLDDVRKFYKLASAEPQEDGYAVLLDGRMVKTKAAKQMVLPTNELAEAIAEEWAKQGEKIDPLTMPMMIFASTALDLIAGNCTAKAAEISKYGETDLICYYAAGPDDLTARQRAAWEPIHVWVKEELNAPLHSTDGIIAVAQPDESIQNLRNQLNAMDHWQIAAMQELVSITGSLVISLGLAKGHLTPVQAIEATQIEENFQAENWGEDEEEAEARGQKSQDLKSAVNFLLLLAK